MTKRYALFGLGMKGYQKIMENEKGLFSGYDLNKKLRGKKVYKIKRILNG